MKGIGTSIIALLWVSVLVTCYFHGQAAPEAFPIGLSLTYHITADTIGEWDEHFEILRWVSELDESTILIRFSSTTSDNALPNLLYVDVSTWMRLDENGSMIDQVIQPPLWVDTTEWHLGTTVQVPSYSGEYPLSSVQTSGIFGSFMCWQVSSFVWPSVDDDYQITKENWYFHQSHGVLIKYTRELIASQHAIYTHRYTKELTSSNLRQFGILSIEESSLRLLLILGLLLLVLIPIIISSTLLFRYSHRTKPPLEES